MTTATQIVGSGSGGTPGFGAAAPFGHSSIHGHGHGHGHGDGPHGDVGAGRLPGHDRPREAGDVPGRRSPTAVGTAPSVSDVVRLPGQEGLPEGGPRRPLITGGAFTLAVAIGLSLDQETRPDGLEPATPATLADGAATEADDAGEQGIDGLTEEEREQVRELQARDAEVRRHEAAHAAAGGQYAGAPTFTYQTGPDGKRYAVGGAVSIDTSPVKGDPEATIRKAQQIRAAANAPADPSSQDRRVAALADSLRQQAQAELAAEQREERRAEEAEADADAAGRAAQLGAPPPETPPPARTTADPEESDGVGSAVASSGDGADSAGFDEETAPGTSGPRGEDAGADGATSPPGSLAPGSFAPADSFAPGAFSGAAASYRGPSPTPRLVSIAV